MPKTCKTCKHWDNSTPAEQGNPWCGDCKASGGEMTPNVAWGQDFSYAFGPIGEPSGEMIVTGENFGCVLWEDKNGNRTA